MKMTIKWRWKSKINHIDREIVYIKSVSVWSCLFVLSNTEAIYETQFMKKLSNTKAELKNALLIK